MNNIVLSLKILSDVYNESPHYLSNDIKHQVENEIKNSIKKAGPTIFTILNCIQELIKKKDLTEEHLKAALNVFQTLSQNIDDKLKDQNYSPLIDEICFQKNKNIIDMNPNILKSVQEHLELCKQSLPNSSIYRMWEKLTYNVKQFNDSIFQFEGYEIDHRKFINEDGENYIMLLYLTVDNGVLIIYGKDVPFFSSIRNGSKIHSYSIIEITEDKEFEYLVPKLTLKYIYDLLCEYGGIHHTIKKLD